MDIIYPGFIPAIPYDPLNPEYHQSIRARSNPEHHPLPVAGGVGWKLSRSDLQAGEVFATS